MSTPHLEARPGEIAETILLPGDPLRAKFIADYYLTEVHQFNQIRNMLGFTGNYQGRRVSVMGTGMGMPSMGIYSHELITQYGVKNLIRIGTAGSYQENVRIKDIAIAQAASTNSSYGKQFGLDGEFAVVSDFRLLMKAVNAADELGLKYHVGNILSSDIYYHQDPDNWKKWQNLGVLCVEMEAYALLLNALNHGVAALVINTISDSLVTGEHLSSADREQSFTEMMRLALELV